MGNSGHNLATPDMEKASLDLLPESSVEENIIPRWHYEKPRQTERKHLQGRTFKASKKKSKLYHSSSLLFLNLCLQQVKGIRPSTL